MHRIQYRIVPPYGLLLPAAAPGATEEPMANYSIPMEMREFILSSHSKQERIEWMKRCSSMGNLAMTPWESMNLFSLPIRSKRE